MQAQKEVVKELKQSLETNLEKSVADVSHLQKVLNLIQNKLAEVEAKLKK